LLPAKPLLSLGACEPFIILLACDVAVVDDSAPEGRQCKARHDHVDADDNAEEGHEDDCRVAPREGLMIGVSAHHSPPGRSNWMVSLSPRGSSSSARTAIVKS